MAKTDNYRKQHEDLLQIVGDISKLLTPAGLKADPAPCAALLAKLAGKVMVHLAMENSSLYPTLVSHADPKIKEVALKFQSEMNGIQPVFEGFIKKWPAKEIASKPEDFIKDTQGIVKVLGARIAAENSNLYDMVDKAA